MQLADVMIGPNEFLCLLSIDADEELLTGRSAKKLFAPRVPRSSIDRTEKGNPDDLLLRQVLIPQDESVVTSGFSTNPLGEQHSVVPGSLYKYHNRAFLLVKGGRAVDCCYYLRHCFPYTENQDNERSQQTALEYVAARPELGEMIFSGGDPLVTENHELDQLLTRLEAIPHIRRLQTYSCLLIVIPIRITEALVERFARFTLQILPVNHINHANGVGETFRQVMAKLCRVDVTLPSQSVLLRGVNDNAQTLANPSNALFDVDVTPYYLHVLDKVQDATHFIVSSDKARQIMRELLTLTSGHLVSKPARETGGKPSKTPLDLQLHQQ